MKTSEGLPLDKLRVTQGHEPSLLSKHLEILELAVTGSKNHPKVKEEADRINSLYLQDLRLGRPPAKLMKAKPVKTEFHWQALPFGLLAAVAVLLLVVAPLVRPGDWWPDFEQRDAAPGLSGSSGIAIKGSSRVWVYWERRGVVKMWDKATPLRNGDRVRAEILAGDEIIGLSVVEGRDGRLLTDPASIWENHLELGSSTRQSFAGSFKLVGEDEGETLQVVVCLKKALPSIDDRLGDIFVEYGAKIQWDQLPQDCGKLTFPLR